MPTFKKRLARLMRDVLVMRVDSPEADAEATYWIDAAGPVCFELRACGDVTVTTLVYLVSDPERGMFWDAISDFNAFYLRQGGYRLFAEGESAIFITQTLTIEGLEATGLGAFLEDFIARCGTCSCWCMAQVDRAAAA